jgi:hypothetical protein
MEFKLPHSSGQVPETALKQIINKVKLMQNGDVKDGMERMGIQYDLNYGVPLPYLRDLSKEYQHDHALAIMLWNKKIRETMILASLLENPKTCTQGQIEDWSTDFTNQEIAEQVSRNLLAYLPFATEMVLNLKSKGGFKTMTAYNTAGWMIKFNHPGASELADKLLDELSASFDVENIHISKALQFFLHSCAAISPMHKTKIINHIKSISNTEIVSLKKLAEEFLSLYE